MFRINFYGTTADRQKASCLEPPHWFSSRRDPGAPLGWMANGKYSEQRMAESIICREKNRDKPVAMVESICGSQF